MNPRRACKREYNQTTVRVRCEGAMHTIELRPDGRLRFHHHDAKLLGAEAFTRQLAGLEPACRCEQVLRAWRGQSPANELPTGLWRCYSSIQYREHPYRPLRIPTVRERALRTVKRLARDAINRADYRRATSQWAGGNHRVRVELDPTTLGSSIRGGSTQSWSSNGKWSGRDSYIEVRLPPWWYQSVYRRGLAIVTDRKGRDLFTLSPFKDYVVWSKKTGKLKPLADSHLIAWVGRPSGGFEIKVQDAIIDTETREIVCWISDAWCIGTREQYRHAQKQAA